MIGRHVVERLLARGDDVTVIQRGASGTQGVREIRYDLGTDNAGQSNDERAAVDDVLTNALQGMDAIIHLAAKVGVAGRWQAFEQINVNGTQRLIDAALACKVPRFVHISSPSVAHAGKSLIGAQAGDANPTNVRGHYAKSKALGEQIAMAANGDDMQVLSLRPHLVWGPGDTQLIQRIVDRARAGRLMMVGSGQAFIDTTYIDNAADAIVAGVDNIDKAAGCALVVSNGQPRTVSEVFRRIIASAGVHTKLRSVPTPIAIAAGSAIERIWDRLDRQDDPPMTRFLAEQLATAHWFDQRQTQELLNWQPVIGLDEGFDKLTQSFARN